MSTNKTILIADDHPLMLKGLCVFIELLELFKEILKAENGRKVLQLAGENKVDLFLLDFKMPDLDGYEVARRLLDKKPATKIIIFSMYSESALVANLISIGVKGFINKNEEPDEIEKAITTVLNGEIYLSKSVNPALIDERNLKVLGVLQFSRQEKELVRLISSGHSTKAIAVRLHLTTKTVETYRYLLMKKVKVRNTSELVHYFHSHGLL